MLNKAILRVLLVDWQDGTVIAQDNHDFLLMKKGDEFWLEGCKAYVFDRDVEVSREGAILVTKITYKVLKD
jgi:hypothetical protein